MNKIDAKAILAEVRENHAKLRACKKHRFPAIGDNYRLGQRMRCLACGGDMSLTDAVMYLRGYIAAGGNAQDVFPDWKE